MTRLTVPVPTRGGAPSHSPPDMSYAPGLRVARGLGWFSIGLGLAELLAPQAMGRITGVEHPELLRLYGVREIACGIGILASARPTSWMWARVAGDALDLATLGAVAPAADSDGRRRALLAAAAVGGVLSLDAAVATQLSTAERLTG